MSRLLITQSTLTSIFFGVSKCPKNYDSDLHYVFINRQTYISNSPYKYSGFLVLGEDRYEQVVLFEKRSSKDFSIKRVNYQLKKNAPRLS
jgi:hypothetical protein